MGLAGFSDSGEVSDWAWDALLWATHEEILRGSEGRLLPGRAVTRVEAAALLQRYLVFEVTEFSEILNIE